MANARWLFLLALAAFAIPARCRTLAQAASSVRWCLPAANDAALVAECTAAVARANSASVNFSCVAGGSEPACLDLISKGNAELITLGGANMLDANEKYDMEPIVAEFYGDLPGAEYYAVAVVPAEFCTAGVTFADLKGKRSCHTGYRRTVGWTLPIGYLTQTGVIPRVNSDSKVQADAESVAAFFSSTCAAGTSEDAPLLGGGAWDKLCTGCKNDCSTNTSTNIYYDYPGALRCVMEDAGDVAFTKHSTALEYASDGTEPQAWSTMAKADLRLLCPAGGCAPVDQFESCNIARAPAYAVMAPATLRSGATGQAVQDALVAAGSDPAFLQATIDIGGIDGFAFSEDTQSLLPVDAPFLSYFGATTKQAYDGIRGLEEQAPTAATPAPASTTPAGSTPTAAATPTPNAAAVRWCLPQPPNATLLAACKAAVAEGNTADVTFDCVAGGNPAACQEMVANGAADLVVVGGSDQLPAHNDHDLEVIAAEYYADAAAGASYFSVAVVPKELCTDSITFADLKGKRSCHTGYRRTAGWTLPVGYLTQSGVIPRVDSADEVQADAESVAAFFSSTCAAGSNEDGPLLGGGAWDGMCTGCKGDCSSNDPYFDYAGTIRCVMEGAGDVAFTKHSTPLEVASDGTEPQEWSTKAKADLRLLCPSGGCAPVDQYESCNIARAPARAIMSRAEMQGSEMGKAVKAALVAGGEELGAALNTIGGQAGVLLGADAQSLLAVDTDFDQFFGASTRAAYEGMTALDELASQQDQTGAAAPSSGSGGVSSGAAAGIGIGCAIAGALLGALAMTLLAKRRGGPGWRRHADSAPVVPGSMGASDTWAGNKL